MGHITSRLVRPFRNFNVDDRAAKVLERRQKVAEPSPYYPSVTEKLTRFRAEHPEFLEAQKKRDDTLHEHLKKVYVESTDSVAQPTTSTKPGPVNRKPTSETDMGALEQTSDVPEGRASLKTVFDFLGKHQSDPQNVTAAKIARECRLDEKAVANVLHYFKVLHLYIPEEIYKERKDLKKIIAEQMKQASLISAFLLPKKSEKKEKPQSDLSETKV